MLSTEVAHILPYDCNGNISALNRTIAAKDIHPFYAMALTLKAIFLFGGLPSIQFANIVILGD